MAGRGRGRGRGFGGGFGGGGFAKQEPFVLFPTDVVLPNIKGIIDLEQKKTTELNEEQKLVNQSLRFLRIWKGSPFYLEQAASKDTQNTEVERFSDKNKPKTNIKRGSLFDIMELKGFPQELGGGSRARQPSRKRARWNSDRELAIFDDLEKQEKRLANADGKKDPEVEKDEDQDEDPEDEDISDDDYNDYNQNDGFDDDEDEYNLEDDGDDEPLL